MKNLAISWVFLDIIIICYEIDMYASYGHPAVIRLQVAGHVTVLQSLSHFCTTQNWQPRDGIAMMLGNCLWYVK